MICEVARAMMYDHNLPLSLWAEATSIAVYIQNMCPHKSLEEKNPEEVFTNIKPSVDHLRIFGSSVYIHIPKENRTKLEPSKKKETFLGYNETSKAYRIYVLSQKFIEVIKDMTFHEESSFHRSKELPCDTEKHEAPSPEPSDSPLPDMKREDTLEPLVDPSMDTIKFPLEKPPVKRKPAWCREIIKEEKKNAAPKDTFIERKKPNKYSGLIAQLNLVIESEPSTFE
jgi:hypothetical protein